MAEIIGGVVPVHSFQGCIAAALQGQMKLGTKGRELLGTADKFFGDDDRFDRAKAHTKDIFDCADSFNDVD